jgi:hypothetical protein
MRNIYYFEYKNIKFKLIQNGQKYKDVLLSILPTYNDKEIEEVFNIASEFLSALAWKNNSLVTIEHLGGHSNSKIKNLKQARCSFFAFRTIPRGYGARGYSIRRIPYIENKNQKLALALFREASSTLNYYLSFLFYWYILDIGQKSIKDKINWINNVFINKKIHIDDFYINWLPVNNNNIAGYLYDDCRCAIAHIVRRKGKRTLELDSYLDKSRISISTRVLKEFAKYYIENNLSLKKNLFLVRKRRMGFPIFISEDNLKKNYFTIAYKEQLK